ncbi:hypothetical protein HMN09_01341100 [Mycena chlorophos]|uniref:Ricin B lectin domain-containing protein n=1 Tax=Mycena chlorophos TaxID=658473 RepID=A0A8H6VRM9_MYCCL|nr:hypothetical protein HMN09_01341100 [Mycena chlorophos]
MLTLHYTLLAVLLSSLHRPLPSNALVLPIRPIVASARAPIPLPLRSKRGFKPLKRSDSRRSKFFKANKNHSSPRRRQATVPSGQSGRVRITTVSNGTDQTLGYLIANYTPTPPILDAASENASQLWMQNLDDDRCSIAMPFNGTILCASYDPTAATPQELSLIECTSNSPNQTFNYDKQTGTIKPIWSINNETASSPPAAGQADDEADDCDDNAVERRDNSQSQSPPMSVTLHFIADGQPTPQAAATFSASTSLSSPALSSSRSSPTSSSASASVATPIVAQAAAPSTYIANSFASVSSQALAASSVVSSSNVPNSQATEGVVAPVEQAEAVFVTPASSTVVHDSSSALPSTSSAIPSNRNT